MDCGHIDPDLALEAIKKTRDTGNEHAFAVCDDGTHSSIVEGTERQVNIDVDCDGTAGIFHVHPNDVMHLSDQDMSVLDLDQIEMVCVSDTQGNMKCELDGEYACVTDLKDESGKTLETAPTARYADDDGTEVVLSILPKGSRCIDYKRVPSRSDYHDSDYVDRCRYFDTGEDPYTPPPAPDDPEPDDDAPEPDPEPEPEPTPDDFDSKRMENAYFWAAQWRGWMVKGPNAGLGGTYYVEIMAGQPILVTDETWRESHVDAIVESMHDHGFPRIEPVDWKESTVDGEGWRVFMDPPTDDRLPSYYVNNWKEIDPTSSFDETEYGVHTDLPPADRPDRPAPDDADPEPEPEPEPDVEPVDEIGDGPVSLDTSDWTQYVIPALRELAAIASEQDNATTAIKLKEAADTLEDQSGETRSLEDQVEGDWSYVVRALNVIADSAEDSDDASKLRDLAESIEEQATADPDPEYADPPMTVGEWERTDFTIDGPSVHLEYEAHGEMAGTTNVRVPRDEEIRHRLRITNSRRAWYTFYVDAYWHWGDESTNERITTVRRTHEPERAYNDAVERAIEWMKENEPSPEVDDDSGLLDGEDYPLEVNGWENVENPDDRDGFGNAAVVAWYRTALSKTSPTRPYEYVIIDDRAKMHGSKTGYSVETERGPHPDDLESTTDKGGGRDLMPKKSAGYGRHSSVSASRAIELAVEHMEDYDPREFDWGYVPDLEISGEARSFRYMADVVNRGYPGKSQLWSNLSITETRARLSVTDTANVLAGIFEVKADEYETWNVSKRSNVTVDAERLVSKIRETNVTDTIRLETEESDETGVPPKLVVYASGARAGSVYVFPAEDQYQDIVPDELENHVYGAQARLTAHEFRRAVRFMKIAGDKGQGVAIRATDDVAEMLADGDVDTARAVLDEDPQVSERTASFYSLDYLNPVSTIPRPKSTNVTLSWSNEFPMQIRYGTAGEYTFIQHLAPRIPDEGKNPWDIEMEQAKEPGDLCPFDASLTLNAEGYTESSSPSLQRAWTGYKIAIAEGDTETAKQYAAVINGIRAANGDEPIAFDELDGFKGIEENPRKTMKQLSAPKDVVLWFHPKADGCRCSSQALQLQQLAENHDARVIGVNTESEAHNEAFRESFDLSFPIVADTDGELIERYGVETDDDGRPERTTVFIRNGVETDRVTGLFGADDAAKRLESTGCGHKMSEPPELLEYIEHPSVVTITGKRRSGKSSMAYYAAEELYQHEGVPPVTVNVPDPVAEKLPEHWTHVSSIRNAPNGAVVVYDEAYRSIHSRTPHSDENLDLTEIVELSAQRNQTLLFVTQNSAILDKVAVGESDLLMMKKPGKLQMQFERPQIRDLSKDARERFEMLPEDATEQEYVYVYGEDGDAFITNDEAPFYDDDVSRSFACPSEPDEQRIYTH